MTETHQAHWNRAIKGVMGAAERLDDGELVETLAVVRREGGMMLEEIGRLRLEADCAFRAVALLSLLGESKAGDDLWPLGIFEKVRADYGLPPVSRGT